LIFCFHPQKTPFLSFLFPQLALRAGNEKDTDEAADTVGCCSLRVEHITLKDPSTVIFDFLGSLSFFLFLFLFLFFFFFFLLFLLTHLIVFLRSFLFFSLFVSFLIYCFFSFPMPNSFSFFLYHPRKGFNEILQRG
jgi:hypothetical protein